MIEQLFDTFRSNPIWNLFLASTGAHAILLVASPLQAVNKWRHRSSSDGDIALPYLFACIGTALWLRYAIAIDDLKLVLLQCYAIVMQLFYLLTMLFYRTKKRKLFRTIVLLTATIVCLFVYVQTLSIDDGRILLGRIASSAQIAGSFICPYLIYKAIRKKSIDFIPFAPVCFTWIMELHAIVYSIGIADFYMLVYRLCLFIHSSHLFSIANTTFFLFDGSLLLMFVIYPTRTSSVQTLSTTKYRPMTQIL